MHGASQPPTSTAEAQRALHQAHGLFVSLPERVTHDLLAADLAAQDIDDPELSNQARLIYNAACTDLACLLCNPNAPDSATHWGAGHIWETPHLRYRLEYPPSAPRLRLDPDTFTQLVPADQVRHPHVGLHWAQPGWGGAVVAIRRVCDAAGRREPFAPEEGFTLPATVTLEFSGSPRDRVALLALQASLFHGSANLFGAPTPLETDLSAPLGIHANGGHVWNGVGELLLGTHSSPFAGLQSYEPPDPQRIPLIFVNGLLLTAYMWQDMINSLYGEAELRAKYQPFVYRYPTGQPIESNAVALRQALAELQARYGMRRGCVLIGQSMGGLLCQMQAVTTGRRLWDAHFTALGQSPDATYHRTPADSPLKQALCFSANPKVRRIIFISVPHRGTEFANGSIAFIGAGLVRIPQKFLARHDTPYERALQRLGPPHFGRRISIDSLSPQNPTLQALSQLPIKAPHHSIIGSRGQEGDSATNSDGVVPYASSHLDSSQSEIVVHGTHDTYGLRETLEEVKRILLLDAQSP